MSREKIGEDRVTSQKVVIFVLQALLTVPRNFKTSGVANLIRLPRPGHDFPISFRERKTRCYISMQECINCIGIYHFYVSVGLQLSNNSIEGRRARWNLIGLSLQIPNSSRPAAFSCLTSRRTLLVLPAFQQSILRSSFLVVRAHLVWLHHTPPNR